MIEVTSAELFFARWEKDHPVEKDCTMTEWLAAMSGAIEAFAAFDPAGHQKLKEKWLGEHNEKYPRMTMAEWEAKFTARKP